MTNLRINGERLWDTLVETSRFGGTEKGGIRRLALSEPDRDVRDWFRAAAEAVGCTVRVDAMGNMYARRPGKRDDLAPIAIGSHLDTQPTGGRFDGVLGVLAGLEVLRTLHDAGYETAAPVEVINWTNEEGARFSPGCMGSAAFVGARTADAAYACVDADGVTFGEALDGIGYRGEAIESASHPLSAFLELHIEQGPVLEDEEKTIGVVTGVQAMRRYRVTIGGEAGHAGTTPMTKRRDALMGAIKSIEAVNRLGLEHGPDMVATVGIVRVEPGSPNVIPERVEHTVDVRDPSDEALDRFAQALTAAVAEIGAEGGLDGCVDLVSTTPAVAFNERLISCVRTAALRGGYSHRDMFSRAGHDAALISRVAPTAMVFVPCAGGLSHNEAESASEADCAAGAQVLLLALMDYDQRYSR